MKRYEAYKDSGIEWIGEIPEGWSVIPMKRGLIINNGKDYKDVQSEDGFPVIGSGGRFAFASKYLYDGEAVLLGRKGTIDKPMYVNGKFWTVDTMFYATPLQNVVTKYMYYQALTIPFGKYSTNTALPSMTQSDLADNPMCFPSLEEQKIIAAYLDYKVGQIDKSISEIDSQIESLKAYRQSVISEAVTKGVDKNARMKDSGIDWIGEIPEGWQLKRVKHECKVTDGTHFSPKTTDEGKPYITVSNVNRDTIDVSGALLISEEDYNLLVKQGCKPKVGDVLLAKDGTVGRTAIVGENNEFVCLSSLGIVSPSKNLNSKYLKYSLDSMLMQDQMASAMAGSALRRITISKINEFIFVLPPLNEQEAIASYLDHKVGQIDSAVSAINSQIEDLNALKQAIISEAVTGKIDVRDWTPSVEQ